MFKYALIATRGMFAGFTLIAGLAFPAIAAAEARLIESYGKLPLSFEANQGQTHKDVRFLSRGPGYSLYLTAGEAVLVLAKPNTEARRDAQRAQVKSVALRMNIVGAAPAPLVSGREELRGKANYFIGKDPAQWHTNVPTYAKVHYREVYPGIDLLYYGNQRQLEFDFVVAPGADPKKIALGFKGANKLVIDAQGDLLLHVAGGAIRQHKPIIYQEVDGIRQEIVGSYVRRGTNRVGFKVAAYDRSRPLVIDPLVLSYSSYLGGADYDSGKGIAVDTHGNAYVIGATSSTDFPTTAGAFQPAFGGGIFVTKLNPTGMAVVYSTFLGGSGSNEGKGIAVDADGNAYVTGRTGSTNFPTTPGAFQPASGGGNGGDAFVTKLNPTGSALVYSTYLGGNSGEASQGIAVDAAGNAYMTGYTTSNNFPTTQGAFQTTYVGGLDFSGSNTLADAFVTKLNPNGSALVYSTYLNGNSSEAGQGIAVDANGSAYVTGYTTSANFPVTPEAFSPTFHGVDGSLSDGFVTKLNPAGSGLVYSTYLGGSNYDVGNGIVVDAGGNAFVTGITRSTDFPTTAGAFQPTTDGSGDAFAAKLNPAGSALVYSTYLGGTGYEYGSSIAVDAFGNAYVTGSTNSLNFPTTPGALQPAFAGGSSGFNSPGPSDGYVTKLNSTGTALDYSTYLGGSGNDYGAGIVVDAAGSAYVTGETSSSNFPTTSGAFQQALGGGTRLDNPPDAFVAKFSFATRFEENAATYTGFWQTFGPETGTVSGGTILASNQPIATATFSFTGTAVTWIGVKCNVCGIGTVSIDGGTPTVVNTAGPGVPGSLFSEPVFSASGLAPGVTHSLVITVSGVGTTTPGAVASLSPTGGGYIAVDAFDVTR